MTDKASEIAALLATTVESMGLELLGAEYLPSPGGAVLRLYIDKPSVDGAEVNGGIEDCDGVNGRTRQSPKVPPRRHRADENVLIQAQSRHADPVAQDGSSREGAGRVDADDTDLFAFILVVERKLVD
jgi:hypothetical protein